MTQVQKGAEYSRTGSAVLELFKITQVQKYATIRLNMVLVLEVFKIT